MAYVCCDEKKSAMHTEWPQDNKNDPKPCYAFFYIYDVLCRSTTNSESIRRTMEDACNRYMQESLSITVRIFNGKEALPIEFPHMVAIGHRSEAAHVNYTFNCGGTIISEYFILTAAHCILQGEIPTVVRMGTNKRNSTKAEDTGLVMNILSVYPYPKFVSTRKQHDIAIIQLESPITISESIMPACLRSDPADVSTDAHLTIAGWGATENATFSDELLKTNLTSMELSMCNKSLIGYANDLFDGLNLGHVCAFDPEGNSDACSGDSGGPLLLYNSNEFPTVIGIISYGIACGSTNPGVYTRVAFYADWIVSIVWPENGKQKLRT